MQNKNNNNKIIHCSPRTKQQQKRSVVCFVEFHSSQLVHVKVKLSLTCRKVKISFDINMRAIVLINNRVERKNAQY